MYFFSENRDFAEKNRKKNYVSKLQVRYYCLITDYDRPRNCSISVLGLIILSGKNIAVSSGIVLFDEVRLSLMPEFAELTISQVAITLSL